MWKLHRLILLIVPILFGMAIGLIGPSPVALANTDAIGKQKSCVLFFHKWQERLIYRSGNCSQTTAISLVKTTDSLGIQNEGKDRIRVSSWSIRAEQSSPILDKYLMAVTQCQHVLCKTIVGLEASLAREDSNFLVLDLDISNRDDQAEFPEKDTKRASEMLCSPKGGILITSRENVAGGRHASLSVAPVEYEICKELVEGR